LNKISLAMGFVFLSSCSTTPTSPEVKKAISAAKIESRDTLEIKIEKSLKLINQDRYFFPPGPQPKLPAPFDEPYHLDSLRTPEQILSQKVGGFCGSSALVFAAMLTQSGVKNSDIQIVEAVHAKDLAAICPKGGAPRAEHPRVGASGHVFVAVKFPDGDWRLINTTDGTNYESIGWLELEEVQAQMKRRPVQIPFSMYRNFPPEFRSLALVVFQSWRPDQVPLHTFEQRLNLIASGGLEGQVCRYGANEMKDLATIP